MATKNPTSKRYRARVHTAEGEVYLGTFDTQEEAQQVEDKYWEKRGGRYASLREPRYHRRGPCRR